MCIPKVSVIIPVYNTEKYVRQAVESILLQTLKDIEIIIVNDGSTDGSMTILEELAAQDERVKLFSQENQGLSVTRNVGLSHSTGEYVYFMDSDDLLVSDTLLKCYVKCKEENLDFVFFDAESFNDEGTLPEGVFDYKRTDKLEDKVYFTHSGYAKGGKEIPFKRQMENDPTKVIELAVFRMLDNNKLRAKRMKRLRLFATEEHSFADKVNK